MRTANQPTGPAADERGVASSEPGRRGAAGSLWPGVVLTALVVRGALVTQPACIDRNGVQLVTFAQQMAADPVEAMRVTSRQPGFAALLLGARRALGGWLGDGPEGWQRCGELLALVGGVAACAAVYLLAGRLFDESTARLAALLAIFWPQGAHLSAQVLSDMPHLALYLAALLLVLRAIQRGHPGRLAASGLLIGAAYLIRQEALGLLPVAAVGWWRAPGVVRRGRGVLLLVAGFVIAVAPHSLLTGQWMPNKNPLDALERVSRHASGAAGGLLAYGVSFPSAPVRMLEDWARSGRYAISILFLVGALAPAAARAEPSGRRLIAMAAAAHVALMLARAAVYGESSARYVAIPAALCIPWAASGWSLILRGLRRIGEGPRTGGLRPRLGHFTAQLIALAVPMTPLVLYAAEPVYGKEAYRVAGRWLGRHAAPDERVLSHEHLEQVLYYAGRTGPGGAWDRCSRGDSVERIASIIERLRPAWYVDAERSHDEELDEAAHVAALESGRVAALEPALSVGPAGRRVLVFRVRAADGRP